MIDTRYVLDSAHVILRHFPAWQYGVQDIDNRDSTELAMRARMRSGDYLVTELDKMVQGLSVSHAPEVPQLEQIVPELLYLDQHFELKSTE